MQKDFDTWNILKKTIEQEGRTLFAHPREIWWSVLGINLGAEIDGKHENFERPVLVVRVYNRHTMLVLPITSKEKNDLFHYKIQVQAKNSNTGKVYRRPIWVKLTQARVISNKRLLRKVDVIPDEEFKKIVLALKEYT